MSAIFYHSQPQSDRTPTSSGRGGGRRVEPECPRSSDPHRLGDGGVGDMEHLVAEPPNPRSDGISSQPSGVQGTGKGRKAKLTAGHEAAPVRKHVREREPGHFQASAVQVCLPSEIWGCELNPKSSQPPTASAATPDPTHLIIVPQSRYECATKQDGWVKMAPIEFGGIKLTDAANKAYHGLHGCDDKVLDYKGVGSSIQCRLNVRRAPQPSQMCRLTLFPQFSGKDVGKLKVCPTDRLLVDGLTTVFARS